MKYTSRLRLEDDYRLDVSTVLLLLILLIGALVFLIFERILIVDAFYTTVNLASTVGFGNWVRRQIVTEVIIVFWLVFSTIGLVKVNDSFTDNAVNANHGALSRRTLVAQLVVPACPH